MKTLSEVEPATEFPDLERVAVIDVGSNSVRLVVFDGAARSPAYFFNEKVLAGLGRGIAESGCLHPEGRARALAAMERFAALAESFKVHSIRVVATAAVREASDGPDFCAEVLAKTGIAVEIASGDDEARLAAQGVLLGWPTAHGLVADIGGASMELAEVSGGEIGNRETSPLGPLKLADVKGDVGDYIAKQIAALRAKISGQYETVYLVGGSFRALAKIDMAWRKYPLEVLHEYQMERAHLEDTLTRVADSTPEDFRTLLDTSSARMQLVPMACRVLAELVRQFGPERVAISSYGLREGLLWEQMPAELRKRDPLLEACAAMERGSARFVGFGAHLARWVMPLVPDTADWRRIVMAAGLLHDVSWRSHPSARAEECFDNASRANLGGLDHRGRVLLAMALLHRYRKSGKIEKYHLLGELLSEEDRKMAKVIGRGLRLGATLAGGDPQVLDATGLVPGDGTLKMDVDRAQSAFMGEVVEGRLRSLASAMGREGILTNGDVS